jgi:hypothetical protein
VRQAGAPQPKLQRPAAPNRPAVRRPPPAPKGKPEKKR